MGFVRRVASWAGLVGGVVVAILLVNHLAEALRGSPPRTRLLGALAFVLLIATIGHAIGSAIGNAVHHRLGGRANFALHTSDRIAGAIVGVTGVLALMWLLIPALASSPGWPAARRPRLRRCARDRPHRAQSTARRRRRSAASSATRRSPRCSTRSRHPTPDRRPSRRPRRRRATSDQLGREGRGHRRAIACRRAPDSSLRPTSSSRTRTSWRGSTHTKVFTTDGTPVDSDVDGVRLQPRPRGVAGLRTRRGTASCAAKVTSTTSVRCSDTRVAARCARRRCASPSRSSPAAPTSSTPPPTRARGVRPRRRHRTRRLRRPSRRPDRQSPRRPLRLRPEPPHHRLRAHHHRTQRSPRPRPLEPTSRTRRDGSLPLRVRRWRESAPAKPVSRPAGRGTSTQGRLERNRCSDHLAREPGAANPAFGEERLAEASLTPPKAAFSASGRRRSDEPNDGFVAPGPTQKDRPRCVSPGPVRGERTSWSLDLDEDALAGALLGGLDHGLFHARPGRRPGRRRLPGH